MDAGALAGGVTPAGHGDTAQADDSAAATPGATANLRLPEAEAGPCRTAARAERYSAIATAESLGAIHAEITAYRRAEQVLSGPELGASRFSPRMEAAQAKCRYAGLPGSLSAVSPRWAGPPVLAPSGADDRPRSVPQRARFSLPRLPT